MGLSKEQRKALRASYTLSEKTLQAAKMVLTRSQLEALLDHLDEALGERACHHSLEQTLRWAESAHVSQDALAASLANFGGYCDCEVLANIEPGDIF